MFACLLNNCYKWFSNNFFVSTKRILHSIINKPIRVNNMIEVLLVTSKHYRTHLMKFICSLVPTQIFEDLVTQHCRGLQNKNKNITRQIGNWLHKNIQLTGTLQLPKLDVTVTFAVIYCTQFSFWIENSLCFNLLSIFHSSGLQFIHFYMKFRCHFHHLCRKQLLRIYIISTIIVIILCIRIYFQETIN